MLLDTLAIVHDGTGQITCCLSHIFASDLRETALEVTEYI